MAFQFQTKVEKSRVGRVKDEVGMKQFSINAHRWSFHKTAQCHLLAITSPSTLHSDIYTIHSELICKPYSQVLELFCTAFRALAQLYSMAGAFSQILM